MSTYSSVVSNKVTGDNNIGVNNVFSYEFIKSKVSLAQFLGERSAWNDILIVLAVNKRMSLDKKTGWWLYLAM